MSSFKPLIGISAGDPAGIGPEICIKAVHNKSIYDICRPLVVCDHRIIEQAIQFLNVDMNCNVITSPEQGNYEPGTINVLSIENVNLESFEFNRVQQNTGNASFEYIIKVIELAKAGEIHATVTGPIHKEAIQMAGHDYAGHTEIFAKYTDTKNYTMMLAENHFRVVHVSTHVSLLDAIKKVTKERVLNVIRLANNGLKQLGIATPKIAVAGLNPHAGEHGLFGREEIDHIIPAIQAANEEGIHAEGPFPPDTIFPKMNGKQYDLVVCMYHDQGHIPTKLLGFAYDHDKEIWSALSGVNITLGLPIIRVSVDHGVAFDKGGLGVANPQSMEQAIKYATQFALQKERVI